MRITFVGHSSIIIWTEHHGILCDPWLSGRVFNNAWALAPTPVLDPVSLDRITHLWISHEHPDHLHFPTLGGFPDHVKSRVGVIFQENNSNKVRLALEKLGYRNFIAAPHDKLISLTQGSGDRIAVYQHRHLDSALIVHEQEGGKIINVNDAELTKQDCEHLRKKYGPFDLSFRQFSIAGFDGIIEELSKTRQQVIATMVDQHLWLAATVTCPIASFMYFCRPDNAALNRYSNTAVEALEAFRSRNLKCHLLFPGATRDLKEFRESEGDFERWASFYASAPPPIDALESPVALASIREAFNARVRDWHTKYPSRLIRLIGKVPVHIDDLNCTVLLDFGTATISATQAEPVLSLNSQPLHFAFATPFGVQTLGVSGRYRLRHASRSWKLVRIISSLYNAEIYLRPRYLLSARFLRWFLRRFPRLLSTVRQQTRRFAS